MVTGIVFSIVITGIMFKDLLLPGAAVMLGVGLMGCMVITIILLIKYLQTNGFRFYKQMLVRVIVIGCAGSIMFFTPGTALVSFFYRNHPDYVKAYQEYVKDPDNIDLLKKLDDEAQKLD